MHYPSESVDQGQKREASGQDQNEETDDDDQRPAEIATRRGIEPAKKSVCDEAENCGEDESDEAKESDDTEFRCGWHCPD